MRKSVYVLAVTLLAGMASPALAQIYAWRDASGHLVLSDRPQAGDARAYAVPEAQTVRATRDVPADRAEAYDDLILEHARRNGVRPDLVRAVVQVESGFNPFARSPKGALGLMQLMPATMREFGVRNAFDPSDNVRAGTAYLRQLLDRYNGNEELALAAYNAGPTAVDEHEGVPPYRETQRYVEKVGDLAGAAPRPPGKVIYKTVEVVNGQAIAHYTDRKPVSGPYEIVGR